MKSEAFKYEMAKETLMEQMNSFDDILPVCGKVVKNLLGEAWEVSFNRRAVRTLGVCVCSQRRIELSYEYAKEYITLDKEDLVRTVLHEIAHALAEATPQSKNEGPHGATWQHYCGLLGIPDEKPVCALKHEVGTRRWALVNADTGEICIRWFRRPRRDFSWLGNYKLVRLEA